MRWIIFLKMFVFIWRKNVMTSATVWEWIINEGVFIFGISINIWQVNRLTKQLLVAALDLSHTVSFTFCISASCFCCILSVSSWCLASKTLVLNSIYKWKTDEITFFFSKCFLKCFKQPFIVFAISMLFITAPYT